MQRLHNIYTLQHASNLVGVNNYSKFAYVITKNILLLRKINQNLTQCKL